MNSIIPIDLGLSDIEIQEVKTDKYGNYHINVCSTLTSGKCHVCGKEITKLHSYDREIEIRHLPILGKECYLHIKLPRYECEHCKNNPKTTAQLPWRKYNTAYTKAFEEHILNALTNSTMSDVSRKENLSEGRIKRILEAHYPDKINWDDFESLGQIGIDEIALKKGHKDFVTIITSRDGEQIRVLAVLKDRKKATVLEFLNSIPKDLKKTITSVCSDLYDGFINAAKEALGRNIRIVIDRFHIAKLYKKCVDTVRKEEMKRLKALLSKKEYGKLKGLMWALRIQKGKLSDKYKAVLKRAFKYSPKLKEVYKLSEALTKIFNTKTSRNGGIRRLKNWITNVQKSGIKLFDTFIKTLEKRIYEIANYFVARENSGFVEGLNNRIKVLKRRAYGIVNRIHLFQRISLDLERSNLANYGR